jgi:hypothetical protein
MPTFADPFHADPFFRKQRREASIAKELDATRPQSQGDGPLDDESLLGSIGRSTLSGLSRIGHLLDVPGAVVRNTATLHNPLAPLLHPFSDEGRTSGRDLLRQAGMIGEDDTTSNWWAGLGAEFLLDPLTWTGIGALTKAGQAAQKAGTLTKGFAPSIKAGERSLFSVGLPLTEHATHIGTGAAAQKAAGYVDTALGAVANSPPGRAVQGLFNPEAMGQFTGLGQQIAKRMYPARNSAAVRTAEQVSEFLKPIKQLRQAFDETFGSDVAAWSGPHGAGAAPAEFAQDLTHHTFERLFGLTAELGGDFDRAASLFSLDPSKLNPAVRQSFIDVTNHMQAAAKAINEQALSKGGWGGVLQGTDDFEHFARYAQLGDADYARAAREFQTIRGSSIKRSDVIGLVPEEIVNRIVTDPLARAKNADDAERAIGHIAQQYGAFLGKGTMLDEAGQVVPRWGGIGEHAQALAEWTLQHPQKAIFLNPKIEDFARYMRQAHVADATMDVVHELAGRHAAPVAVGVDLTQLPTTAHKVPLPQFYEQFARMKPKESLEYLAGKTGLSVKDLSKLAMPLDMAQAVQATRNFHDDPRWLGAIGDVLDGFTNFWKQSVTLPFPSFAGRNLGSGQYVNAASGLMPTFAHLSQYGQHVRRAFGMLTSGIDPALERELVKYGVFNPRQLSEGVEAAGVYGRYGSALPANPLDWRSTWDEAGQVVGQAPTPGEALSSLTGKTVPFADRIPAALGLRQGAQFAMGTGAKVNQWVEFLNRVPMYSYLRSQGWDAAAAAAKVKELQIDYSRHTFAPFENQVMKRLVPFYSFQRKIAPVILQNLLQRPGGLMGQTIRASRLAAGDDPTTPDYIAEGLSIPNPFKNPPPGGASYLGGFGLPYEQLAQYIAPPHVAGRELLSQLNPLIKFPLEASTGQTFFQAGPGGYGRQLEDLDPPIGRTLSNLAGRFAGGFDRPVPIPRTIEHLAANSPATRFISTARQLSDPRKTLFDLALANLTGIRPVDVSEAARDAVLRDRSREIMHQMGAREFSRIYFPDWRTEQLSPEQRQRAQQLESLQTELAVRAKDRAKAKKLLAAQ